MKMSLDSSRRVLNTAAIFDLVSSIPLMLLGLFGFGLVRAAVKSPQIMEYLSSLGDSSFVAGGSAFLLLLGVLAVVESILAFRAVKDPTKIKPAWTLALITFVLDAGNVVFCTLTDSLSIHAVLGLMIGVLVFSAANTLKEDMGL